MNYNVWSQNRSKYLNCDVGDSDDIHHDIFLRPMCLDIKNLHILWCISV